MRQRWEEVREREEIRKMGPNQDQGGAAYTENQQSRIIKKIFDTNTDIKGQTIEKRRIMKKFLMQQQCWPAHATCLVSRLNFFEHRSGMLGGLTSGPRIYGELQ